MILVIAVIPQKARTIKIGKGLLRKRLIACYNLSPIQSGYRWKGKIVEEEAFQLLLKSKRANFKSIEKYITENSGEEIPEIIMLKPESISTSYLKWLKTELL